MLWGWNLVWALIYVKGAGGTWHYFDDGARLLFGGGPHGGLHLYAARPDLQIGPVAFLIASPLTLLGPLAGRVVAVVLMALTGPLLLKALWRMVPEPARDPARLQAAGVFFLPVWAVLATHAGHLDDILALAFTVGAMHARIHRHPVLTGLLIAAAADSKPWALAFAPLLLTLPIKDCAKALAACAAGLALAWSPFQLYDPHTLSAIGGFTIDNAASSGLRALGYTGASTPPWDRPAQLLLGAGLGAIAVLRGRWPAVILLGTAARILLDPEVYGYYLGGVLLGAVAFDLIVSGRRWPWVTIFAVLSLHVDRLLAVAGCLPLTLPELGWLRVAFVVVAAMVAIAVPISRAPLPVPAGDEKDQSRRPSPEPGCSEHPHTGRSLGRGDVCRRDPRQSSRMPP